LSTTSASTDFYYQKVHRHNLKHSPSYHICDFMTQTKLIDYFRLSPERTLTSFGSSRLQGGGFWLVGLEKFVDMYKFTHFQVVPRSRKCKPIHPSHIRHHGVVFNLLNTGTTFYQAASTAVHQLKWQNIDCAKYCFALRTFTKHYYFSKINEHKHIQGRTSVIMKPFFEHRKQSE
jgi:hypothetical protein